MRRVPGRRRICIVRQQNFYELPVRREAEAFRDAGFEVHVLLMAGEDKSGSEEADGVIIHRVPGRRVRGGVLRYLWDYVAFFVAASTVLSWLHVRNRFDVIQVNTMPDILAFATLVPRLMGAVVTVFMKEPMPELFETIYGNRRLFRLLAAHERWAIKYAHAAFTVTEELKQRYVERGAPREKITVVLNGPDGRNLLEHNQQDCVPDPNYFTVVCNGTIEDRYGHATLLRGVAIARRSEPRIRVRITGTGNAVPRLEAMINELQLAETVSFLGWLSLDELVCELTRADAGVIPMEASPYSHLIHTNKMYDYTLFGKPVIASRLRSVEEYFDDSSISFFEPGDPESLAGAMIRLAADSNLQESLAAKAQSLLDAKFGWEHQSRILVDTTIEVLTR
jgi:glycosyltransferase involved in cell wall biosynthesis